ncbi:MAG: protein kinase [Clostridia bacterium]|nr:protein kinase [Clostridia bacterium]
MAQSFEGVFGKWNTEKCIGTGTDGRVYTLVSVDENQKKTRSVLKTIRVNSNRSESKGFNPLGEIEKDDKSAYVDEIIENIKRNIKTIQTSDGGKRFVKYEDVEVRETSDGKGKIILIRLEEMRSLSDLLNEFSFTLEETIRLGIEICKSLIRCRDFGYIYPNLKPENILFDAKGVCKLGDFGSFSLLEPSKTSVAYKRTQHYMAPEYLKNDSINCTSDTYSLGLILYMLINRGRLPFTEQYPQEVTLNGLNRSKENRCLGMSFPEPATQAPMLMKVISKACAFKETDRYLTPKQMLSDLNAALRNKPASETEYDDIYSYSAPTGDEADAIADVVEYKEEKAEEISYPEFPVSLHEEIPVPDVSPFDYLDSDKKPVKRRKAVAYTSVPKNKSLHTEIPLDVKKLAAIIAAIILVMILFIVSLSLRGAENSVSDVQATLNQGIIYLSEVISFGS